MSSGKPEGDATVAYPLKFEPLLKETIWGGNRLESMLGLSPASGRQIGEAWIVWDGLRVANGPWQGRSLGEVVKTRPEAIFGKNLALRHSDAFPLLVKLIDARDNLSVQVHPGDDYAYQHESGSFGKSEMWLILDAEDDASIIHGFKRRVDALEVADTVQAVQLGELLETVPVRPGDVVYNPAGTVHALLKGTFIYELQQSSDVTYRLYDWGRKQPDGTSRQLHVEKSIDVLIPEPFALHKIRPVELPPRNPTRRILCVCRYFVAEWVNLSNPVVQSTEQRRFDILTVLDGAVEIRPNGTPDASVSLSLRESALVPASLGDYELHPTSETATLIKAYVPDLLRDVVIPLREAGVSDEDILQLGGDPSGNDLAALLTK